MSDRFIALFLGLLALLLVHPFLVGAPRSGALIQLGLTAVVVGGVFALSSPGMRRAGFALAFVAAFTGVAFYATDGLVYRLIDLFAVLAFCVLAFVAQANRVLLAPGPITLSRVVGALCLYLLMGLAFAVTYTMLEVVQPGAFDPGETVVGEPLDYLLYYSFVSLTTLGFGDIAPVHPVARSLTMLEAVSGQLYIAVLIAAMVGRWVATRDRE